ncbi:MAG TPA: trimeric intracellular cation channel family protein [Phnomibacter sp.]|nr:trimeric intracellular cation channel family protein [Phnomibacter sp.]
MPAIPFELIVDVLGTAAFAISGASQAIQKRFDVFGIVIIAFATAIGGGTVRDVLLGALPVAWMQNEIAITVILVAALGTILFHGHLKKLTNTLFLFDTLGLALFTFVGIEKGLAYGFSPGMAIALGTITGCFGGVTRDVLLNQVPVIFRKEIYASACILGGLLFFLLQWMGLHDRLAQLLGMAVVVGVRILAVRFHLSLPPVKTRWQ